MTPNAKIAVLDDDPGVRAALGSLVRSLGHDVRAYASATAFLDDAAEEEPDCIIADIQMPLITGDALQARLIADGRPIPMIFMTGFPQPGVRDRVLAAGAAGFILKPVDAEEIARLLARVLEAGGRPQTFV